jgi:pathogenesis-related protein 1
MNPINIVSVIVGGATSAFGGIFLLVPAVHDSKWGLPTLIGAIIAGIALIVYQIVVMVRARRPVPPSFIQPEISPPSIVQPPPFIQPPSVTQPPLQQPIMIPTPPVTTPIVQQPLVPEQPTFKSMEEFEKWLVSQQAPTAPPITVPQPPIAIPEPQPITVPQPPPTTPTKTRRPRPTPVQQPPQVVAPPPAISEPSLPTPQAPPVSSPSTAVIGQTGSSLTPEEAAQMLESHNRRRAQYGTPPLVWDANIASSAQAWSNQQAASGKMQHDNQDTYGENLAFSSGKFQTPEEVVYSWSDKEAPYYDYATNSCKGGGQCLHHTQVLWKDSKKLGCGKTQSGRQEFYTCRYTPAGNYNMESGNRPY